MPELRFKSISIEIESYEKLATLAERNYRSIPREIARLVDAEVERVKANIPELDEHLEAIAR